MFIPLAIWESDLPKQAAQPKADGIWQTAKATEPNTQIFNCDDFISS